MPPLAAPEAHENLGLVLPLRLWVSLSFRAVHIANRPTSSAIQHQRRSQSRSPQSRHPHLAATAVPKPSCVLSTLVNWGFVSQIVQCGGSVKDAMELARHHDADPTFGRYTPTPGLRICRRSWTGCPTCGFPKPFPHRLSQSGQTGPPRTIGSPVQNGPRWTHQDIQIGFSARLAESRSARWPSGCRSPAC